MAEYIDRAKTQAYLYNNMMWYDEEGYIAEDSEKDKALWNLVNGVPTADVIPLDRIKQAREEIENEIKFWSEPSKYNVKPVTAIKNAKAQSYKHCLEILDKLIESEGE